MGQAATASAMALILSSVRDSGIVKELADGCGGVRSVDGSEDCGDESNRSTASLLLDKGDPKEELFCRVRKRSGCSTCTWLAALGLEVVFQEAQFVL